MYHSRRRRSNNRVAIFLSLFIILLTGFTLWLYLTPEDGTNASTPVQPEPTPDPTIRAVSTATLGNTGDILIHSPILTATKQSDGTYSFDKIFTYLAPYAEAVDFSTINLELSMPGSDYQGYPTFRVPDTLVDSILSAGFDLVTTANNHANDSGENGMMRTAKVLTEKGLPFIGTRSDPADKRYRVQTVNDIHIGMVSYTHGAYLSDGRKSLNGIPCTTDSSAILNMFDYSRLDDFYDDLKTDLDGMKADGAEVFVIYIHWGDEYHLKQNSTQEAMAQKLCDLGFDVIIGCHPHVVQPVTVLHSDVSKKSSLCVYSMGNAVSNQRIEYMDDIKSGHTEDGMFVTFTFTKYSDGSVRVTDGSILPTWVHLYKSGGRKVFQIVPLDQSKSDWGSTFNLNATGSGVSNAKKSYQRTMDIVSGGLGEWDAFFAKQQQELDAKNDDILHPKNLLERIVITYRSLNP